MQYRKEPSVQTTVKFSRSEREMLERLSAKTKKDMSTLIRQYVNKGLKTDGFKQDEDALHETVTNSLKSVLEPSVERLAALNAKTGIMAAAGYFLMVLMLQGNFPDGDVSNLATKARKLAITYLKSKDESVEQLINSSIQSLMREAE